MSTAEHTLQYPTADNYDNNDRLDFVSDTASVLIGLVIIIIIVVQVRVFISGEPKKPKSLQQ